MTNPAVAVGVAEEPVRCSEEEGDKRATISSAHEMGTRKMWV